MCIPISKIQDEEMEIRAHDGVRSIKLIKSIRSSDHN